MSPSLVAELLAYLVLICVFVVAVVFMRRHVKRVVAAAPPESRRSVSQMRLHYASAALALLPFAYVFFMDPELVWPFVASLGALSLQVLVAHFLRVRLIVRLLLLPLFGVVALFAGATVSSWPAVSPSAFATIPLMSIGAATALFCGSWLLSVYSFPPGFGERK